MISLDLGAAHVQKSVLDADYGPGLLLEVDLLTNLKAMGDLGGYVIGIGFRVWSCHTCIVSAFS